MIEAAFAVAPWVAIAFNRPIWLALVVAAVVAVLVIVSSTFSPSAMFPEAGIGNYSGGGLALVLFAGDVVKGIIFAIISTLFAVFARKRRAHTLEGTT